jgi:hypothetical protein
MGLVRQSFEEISVMLFWRGGKKRPVK